MTEKLRLELNHEKVLQYLKEENLDSQNNQFIKEAHSIELFVHPDRKTWEFHFIHDGEYHRPDDIELTLKKAFATRVDTLNTIQVLDSRIDHDNPAQWVKRNFDNLKNYISADSGATTTPFEYARVEASDDEIIIKLADEEWVQLSYDRGLDKKIELWVQARLKMQPVIRFESGDFRDDLKEDAERFEAEQEEELEKKRRRRAVRAEKEDETILQGGVIKTDPRKIRELPEEESRSVTLQGQIIDSEFRQTSTDKNNIIQGVLSDRTDSIEFKLFTEESEGEALSLDEEWVKMRGSIKWDNYSSGDRVLYPNDINQISPLIRNDEASKKRVELHCHSSMSALDALCDVEDIVERAAFWDHPAVAITDHGVAHSFPEAAEAGDEYGVKIIYGVEGYLVQDQRPLVLNVHGTSMNRPVNDDYVVLDLAMTGLNPHRDKVFQVSAIQVRDGEKQDEFNEVINVSVPDPVLNHSTLHSEDLREGSSPVEAFSRLEDFIGDQTVLTYEADAVRHFMEFQGVELSQPIVHLRRLVEELWEPSDSDLETIIQDHWNETFENHFDTKTGSQHALEIFRKLQDDLPNIITIETLENLQDDQENLGQTNHIILLAINQTGLKNLYRLVSRSHTENFQNNPCLLRSEIDEHRLGLLVGSACEAGEIFQSALHGESDQEIKDRMDFYDLIEVQPVENNRFMLKEGGAFRDITSEEDIKDITQRIYNLAQEKNKPVVGTGDVHFMDPEDEVYRRILQFGQEFDDAENQPPLYFRTSDEMIDRFRFLGEDEAIEVAVENPRYVSELCQDVDPIPEGFHPPNVENAEDQFLERIKNKVRELYGNELPEPVRSRLKEESETIIDNEFSNLYVTAARLVDKSHQDGYLVGSRGSVGSSFTAYLMDITEVNPLPPHYRCSECQWTGFPDNPQYECGIDLPPKSCPQCGSETDRDGFNIPFEVFCGFEGDKIPDIDLNFSGEYQGEMFNYVEELFGETNVFRAGTIDTFADKTAAGFVNGYLSEKNLTKRQAEKIRLKKGLTGVKQNTSQHPGGMIIVPEDRSIYEFTPINYPANDEDARFETTHFDYHAMEEQLVKLDVLGHDDPTQLRHLQELTGLDPVEIPLDDEKTMKLFSDISVLGLEPDDLGMETGVLAVPEFNTNFVRGMVEETSPESFADLIRISGLSHGEQVWRGNARELIREEKTDLTGVISCRDDIMNRLISHGMPEQLAFNIMEDVRKGRGLSEDQKRKMKAQGVPEWYVKSCTKISYLFPKAHAAAYVVMAFRIAYFKVHYPAEFYASYFSLKTQMTNAKYITSQEQVEERMRELEEKINRNEDTQRDRGEYSVLEVVKEAYLRGISIKPPQVTKSKSRRYTVNDKTVRAPYVTIDRLGGKVAETIKEALRERPFSSIEDATNRTGLNETVAENAQEYGFFEELPDQEHHDLFETV